MSEENVDIVSRYFEALNRGGVRDALDAVEAFCVPEIEFHDDSGHPQAAVYRGRELVEEIFRRLTETGYRFEVERLIDGGENVIALFHERHHGTVSGADIEIARAWVFTFSQGLITKIHAYESRERALEAVGLNI